MGQVLAVVSQKGGVGKTTTAVNLAASFARRGLKTLLVDVDPQGAIRYGIGLRSTQQAVGISDFLSGDRALREVILPTALPWLRVILAGTVSNQATQTTYHELISQTNLLGDLLSTARERCHVVVVDTPPGLGDVVHRVLEGSQHVVVPLQAEPLALQTTPQILRAIQEITARNTELTLDGLILTMFDETNPSCLRVAEYVRQHMPRTLVFDTVIPRTQALAEAFSAGQPLVLRDPANPASRAYIALAEELMERMR
ncbi:MAG TPA: ParA family protein [Gemmatimonadaceae bacterium]|nr:ParA family protein [Gemmatimonadaceae bacterium]